MQTPPFSPLPLQPEWAVKPSPRSKSAFDLHDEDTVRHVTAAERTAWNAKLSASSMGAANGLATLDSSGRLTASQIPDSVDEVVECASLPSSGSSGKIYVVTATGRLYRWTGSAWAEIGGGSAGEPEAYLKGIAAETGKVVVTKKDNSTFDITASGVGAAPASHTHANSDLVGLADWAKAEAKPSYTASEVGAASNADLGNHTGDTAIHVTAADKETWNAKQAALTFDATPTADSTNPVTSGGVKTALDGKMASYAKIKALYNAGETQYISGDKVVHKGFSAWVGTKKDPTWSYDPSLRWFNTIEEAEASSMLATESEWEGPGWYENSGAGPGISRCSTDASATTIDGDYATWTRTEETDTLATTADVSTAAAAKQDKVYTLTQATFTPTTATLTGGGATIECNIEYSDLEFSDGDWSCTALFSNDDLGIMVEQTFATSDGEHSASETSINFGNQSVSFTHGEQSVEYTGTIALTATRTPAYCGAEADVTPTDGSNRLVTSGGVYDAVDAAISADVTHVKSVSVNSGGLKASTIDDDGDLDVSTLFSSANTSTDPAASGLLSNAMLDKSIVKVVNSIVATPNATLETALGTAS